MTNFDFLTSDPQFNTFSSIAVFTARYCIDIKIGHPAESGQTGNPEKIPDAEILWVRRY